MTLNYLGIIPKSQHSETKKKLAYPALCRRAKNNKGRVIPQVEVVLIEEVKTPRITRSNLKDFHRFFTSSFAFV